MYWFRFDIDAYRRDTARLSVAEHGVYSLLMQEAYATEKPLPLDIKALCFICRAMTKAERDAVASVVRQFFIETPEGWVCQRIIEETERYRARVETNRNQGRTGGRPAKTESDTPDNRIGSESVNSAEPNDNPNQNLRTKNKPTALRPTPKPPSAQARWCLPAWVPADAWDAYEDMRRRKRCSMTDRARQLAVAELARLAACGHDARAVLEQSVLRSWTGLFEVKSNGANNHQSGRSSPADIAAQYIAEAAARRAADAG